MSALVFFPSQSLCASRKTPEVAALETKTVGMEVVNRVKDLEGDKRNNATRADKWHKGKEKGSDISFASSCP